MRAPRNGGFFFARGLLNGNSWAFVLAGRNVARVGPGIPVEGSNRAVVGFWRVGDTNAPRGMRAASTAIVIVARHCMGVCNNWQVVHRWFRGLP